MYGCRGKVLPDDVLTTQYAADNDTATKAP